jgi:spermidine synthase
MTPKTALRPLAAALMAAAAATPAVAPAAARGERVLHEERSLYRNMYVTQEGDERCLLFRARRGAGRESCMYVSNPDRFVFEYAPMMMAGLYVNPRPRNILVIGLGGGTLPTALQELLPEAKIDVVELDAAVHRVAQRYFDFKKTPNTRVFIEDGRVFVKRMGRAKAQYDLIMLDAFESDYIPEHMLTQEFLREVRAIMAPRGVLVANTWSTSGLYDHESTTYQSVFGSFYNLKQGNRIIMTRLGGLPSPQELRANAQAWEARLAPRGASMAGLLPMMRTNVDWDTKARILTDQYSPSNVLNSRSRG